MHLMGVGGYVELVVYRVPIAVYVTVCRQLHAVVCIAVYGDHYLSLGCSADVFQDAHIQFGCRSPLPAVHFGQGNEFEVTGSDGCFQCYGLGRRQIGECAFDGAFPILSVFAEA